MILHELLQLHAHTEIALRERLIYLLETQYIRDEADKDDLYLSQGWARDALLGPTPP